MANTKNISVTDKLIQAKEEVTYRTNPTPALGTDDMYARKVDAQPNIARAEKVRVGPSQSGHGTELGSLSSKIDLEFDFVGMVDSPLTLARWTRFLKAAGMAVAGTGGPPIDTQTFTWSPRTALTSLTMIVYMFAIGSGSAIQQIITGCRFRFDIEMAVNQIITAKFQGEGYNESEADATPTLGSIAYDATALDAVAARNVTFELNSVVTKCKKFSLKTNREVTRTDQINDALGVGHIDIGTPAGKTHELNIDFEMQLLADYNHWSILRVGTIVPWEIAWQSPAGSITTISGASAKLKDMKFEEDGAIMRVNATYELLDSAGASDAFDIEFTVAP